MSLRLARPILLAVLGFILILAVSIAVVVFARSDAGSVSVATDASSYAPGDPVTVTVVNGTTTSIASQGGCTPTVEVCQDHARLGSSHFSHPPPWKHPFQ